MAWDAILLKKTAEVRLKQNSSGIVVRRGVYLTCHYICNRSHFSHVAWCLQAPRLTRFAVHDHSKVSNLTYLHRRKFVDESTFQQQVIHILTFNFGIKNMRYDSAVLWWWWWFNTRHIVRNFLLEQWIRSAWSVKSVLVWEPAKLLWRKECGWW